MNINVKRTYPLPVEDMLEMYLREDKTYSEYVDNPNNQKVQVCINAKPMDCSKHATLGKLTPITGENIKVRKRKLNTK